jgi:hypothetical protein
VDWVGVGAAGGWDGGVAVAGGVVKVMEPSGWLVVVQPQAGVSLMTWCCAVRRC